MAAVTARTQWPQLMLGILKVIIEWLRERDKRFYVRIILQMSKGIEMEQHETSLAIGGMSCAACAGRVERALHKVPGVQRAVVNLATEQARIASTADVQALI